MEGEAKRGKLCLEAVEASRLGHGDLSHKATSKIFVDDAVAGREEGQDGRNEMPLAVIQFEIPVDGVRGEVDFFLRKEGK